MNVGSPHPELRTGARRRGFLDDTLLIEIPLPAAAGKGPRNGGEGSCLSTHRATPHPPSAPSPPCGGEKDSRSWETSPGLCHEKPRRRRRISRYEACARRRFGRSPPTPAAAELADLRSSSRGHGLSCRLWSMLHRSIHFFSYPRHARRKACGSALHPPRGRLPLRAVRRPQPSGGLFESARDGGDVRDQRCRGAGLSRTPRTNHRAGIWRSARRLSTVAPPLDRRHEAPWLRKKMGQKPPPGHFVRRDLLRPSDSSPSRA